MSSVEGPLVGMVDYRKIEKEEIFLDPRIHVVCLIWRSNEGRRAASKIQLHNLSCSILTVKQLQIIMDNNNGNQNVSDQ